VAKISEKGENGRVSGDESVAPGGEIGQARGGFARLGTPKFVHRPTTIAF
jgi:hypothetical protein